MDANAPLVYSYVVLVASGGAFTTVVPVTDLVAGGEQTERRRAKDHGQGRYDHLPRTRRAQLAVSVEQSSQYTHAALTGLHVAQPDAGWGGAAVLGWADRYPCPASCSAADATALCSTTLYTSNSIILSITNKKFELMLTRCAKAYSSSGSVV